MDFDNTTPAVGAEYTEPEIPETGFPPLEPEKTKPEKSKGRGKRVLAALLALVLLLGSCGVTDALINARWEQKAAAMERDFQGKLQTMQTLFDNKLDVVQEQLSAGLGYGSNGTASADGLLNPGQVYAGNVASVVLIYNEVTANIMGQTTTGTSTGSGFILTEDGYVATNHHVIAGNGKITVITSSGESYEAKLIGSDETNDVALLKVEAQGLKPVKLGSSSALSVGDQVAAIGNPLGDLTSTLTVGYVSAKERDVSTEGTIINMLQTDAAINSGNSGGPLFNMKGEVIGITTAKFSGTTSSGASIEGIGFAIPIDDVREILEDLATYGYVRSAYLGVMVRNMNTTEMAAAELYNFPVGVYVESVEKGNCAFAAGLRAKDIILELGGYEVETLSDLTRALRRLEPGQTTTITVFRAPEQVTLTITLDEKPREETSQTPQLPQQLPGQMPSDGSFEEWYEYFAPFFGQGEE